MNPELALQNLALVADQALLNGQDRRNINTSLEILGNVIKDWQMMTKEKADQKAAQVSVKPVNS